MPTEFLSVDPTALIVLFSAGIGVIYVVRIFTAAQTIREREMWEAIRSLLGDVKEINNAWLATTKEQGNKSDDAIRSVSSQIASLNVKIENLTNSVDQSTRAGTSLHGASNLMVSLLKERDGNGRSAK